MNMILQNAIDDLDDALLQSEEDREDEDEIEDADDIPERVDESESEAAPAAID